MSRIAKKPVPIPKGVECTLTGQQLMVKGPKGSLTLDVHQQVRVQQQTDDGESGTGLPILTFKAKDGSKTAIALSGTMRALANNLVTGVSQGFERQLALVGVGYRAQVKDNIVNLALGFSHPVNYTLPEGVTAETPNNTTIVLRANDKQLLGQTAAEIRAYRPPEPYKGKGIHYVGEHILRKEAKKK
ncbi:MAG: 50S ribosomal protein L6 [Legionellales bacterium]|nr:50S ribosomal protein L6 [Legionellales bacterium]